MTDVTAMTAWQWRQLLDRGEVRAQEIVQAYAAQIERTQPALNSFLTLSLEVAEAAAQEADRRLARGERGLLLGLPVAVKDNLCTTGVRTTAASRILENFVPPYDATVVSRLKAAGAPILGKTNLDEFAMGSSTENSAFGPTRNPWDLERVPGGSSGGSAAAVAAVQAPLALGSDTGGSIRQPAALCGIVGLKPTYGLVSRFGLIAFASSLDQIGPMARDVRDCAMLLQVIAGHDPMDATSVPQPVPDYLSALRPEVRGLRIGLPKEYFVEGIAPDVRAVVERAVQLLAEQGAEVVEVSLPHTEYALATYYLIAPAEASSNLARYDGVRYGLRVEAADVSTLFEQTRAQGFGAEVKRRIMLGTYALSAGYYDAYYGKAQQVRTLIRRDFEEAFSRCDVLATPTTPTVAFALGEKVADPLQMYLSDICTIPVNLAGLPGLSVPCGLVQGLPVGLQLIGPPFAEARLLQVAYTFEQAAGLAPLTPALAAGTAGENAEAGVDRT